MFGGPVPPPPAVGDRYYNKGHRRLLHHVRAVVDASVAEDGTHFYIVVFRFWHKNYWHYKTEYCWAFGDGLYEKAT